MMLVSRTISRYPWIHRASYHSCSARLAYRLQIAPGDIDVGSAPCTEWTKDHFQDHRRERGKQFICEHIRIADQLMSTGGYGHLIVAGSGRMTAEILHALPKHMKAKLVDVVAASANDRIPDVVAATVQYFLDQEETESLQNPKWRLRLRA